MGYSAVMIRAFIFDLDGTLVDTLGDITAGMNGFLERHGWPGHSADEYRYMVGGGLDTLLKAAVPASAAGELETLHDEAMAVFERMGAGDSRPYPGTREALELLSARGIPISVVSNKPQALARTVVEHLFPGIRFALVLGGHAERPIKPHPAGALQAARAMGVEPHDCGFVGDSDVDMLTANAAGMHAVGALWGFRTREELSAAGAEILAASIGDIPALAGT